jgi:hypothetical protein
VCVRVRVCVCLPVERLADVFLASVEPFADERQDKACQQQVKHKLSCSPLSRRRGAGLPAKTVVASEGGRRGGRFLRGWEVRGKDFRR